MLTNLFRRKPPPTLKEALTLINQASRIVLNCRRDKSFIPNKSDLALLQQVEHAFHEAHASSSYVHRCMQQRIEGKPEGAAKFNDKEVFDYHYPK